MHKKHTNGGTLLVYTVLSSQTASHYS